MTVTFQPNLFASVTHEIAALVDEHWDEVGSLKDQFDRQIDYAAYQKLENERRLLCVIARQDDRMFGYALGVIGMDLHRVTKGAHLRVGVFSALVYYVEPRLRGYASWLVRATEAEAASRGCQIANWRVKPGLNRADAFFARIGYFPMEVTMTRLIGEAAHAELRTPETVV